MNTDLLRTFLEVAKIRHFGRAADNLYLTQSAVSFRIKQLEEIVGVELFTRQRNNILLTPAGERLLPHAENILASWQLALQDVGVADTLNIQLALGGTSNLWDTFLQSLLPKLADRFPDLYIRTEISSPHELTRALHGGRLDLIVLLEPPSIADLEAEIIGNMELVMVADQKNMALNDIPMIGHVFVDWGTAFNLKQARLFNEPVAPVLHTGQSHIALEFLLNHGGAAFLPLALVQPYLDSGQLHLVSDADTVTREVFVVYSRESERAAQLGPIISVMKELEIKPSAPSLERKQA